MPGSTCLTRFALPPRSRRCARAMLVRITEAVSPRYLAGMLGTVIDLDDHAATIRLPRPVGRFHRGHVRCPPLALEKLATPTA